MIIYTLVIFILWLVLSVLCGVYASTKGRSDLIFFFLSLFLSPMLGLIILLAIGPNVVQLERELIIKGTKKRCTKCCEIVKMKAKICKFCNYDFKKREIREKENTNDLFLQLQAGKQKLKTKTLN